MSEGDEAAARPGQWPEGLTGTDGEFLLRSDSALELAAGFRQLAMMAERHVEEHDMLAAGDIADRSVSARSVPGDVRERLIAQLSGVTEGFKQRVQRYLDQLDPDSVRDQVTDPFQWMMAGVMGLAGQSVTEAAVALRDVSADNMLVSYLMQYSQAFERRPLLPVMRRALLITAVASAETMLIGVMRRIQYDQGGAARWGPWWDAPELERKVRRLTGGGIEDWVPRLRRDLGVDLPAGTCDWPAVVEVWARRNVLVHSGGIADEKYVERVPGADAGTLLQVDSGYLQDAIDLLCGFVLGVILLVWAGQPERRMFAIQLATLHVVVAESELRWPLAESLHSVMARLEDDPQRAAASQVNAWLARTHWRGPESIQAEVIAWPVGDLPLRFTLAKMILLGQTGEAMAMLPDLLHQGEITKDDLRQWALFESVRGEPEFQRFLAE